uniref:Uncharacterized protein n=1 Tax=Rhizophora mucronata TaxID=61149 RepID=A0A2P2NVX3_RHIMU
MAWFRHLVHIWLDACLDNSS